LGHDLLIFVFVAAILGGCGQSGFAGLGQLAFMFGQAAGNAAAPGLQAFAELFGISLTGLAAAAFGVASTVGCCVALC
jgi:hypothetical protein